MQVNQMRNGKIMCFYLLGLTAVGMCGIEGTCPGFFLSTPLSQKHKYKQLPTAPSHQNKKQYDPYYESLLDAGYFHLSKD